ncbi:ABC transporter transmembrane domain-containing protein [Buchnera aphidicola]|uniref:ABC transporter transmembrane domain-containing protein n=1 Tax=Buchnera aphidicola TaxID=9 RepID=UPI0020937B61|nr:ABC transporter transmembrane domain-containing protein [Buchnera aphidicola]USS94048.1 ABC transporter transmembrane domain-containing protein [Buchnera aphidicola (Sipha maydis)]WII23593.1 ABC transporter transmembrane domain-containing protein [Buchnera aphidicola (Sipha maydis)]
MRLFKQLGWYFIKEWKRYLGSVLILIIISFMQIIPPKIVGILVDSIIKKNASFQESIKWIYIMIFIAFSIYVLRYIWRILLFGASYKLAIKLRALFYKAIIKQNSDFYLQNRTGDLITRVSNDIERIVFAAGEGVLTLVDSTVMGLSVLIVMCTQISYKLTLFTLIPMPIMTIFIKKYGKELHRKFFEYQKSFSIVNNKTQEILTSIRMVRAFGLEKIQLDEFLKLIKKSSKKNIEVAKVDAKFDPVIYLSIALSNLLAVSSGSWLVWNKVITLGQLTSFIMYLGLMIWPMLALAWMFNIVERGSSAWNRIQKIINFPISVTSGNKNIPKKPKNITIKIKKFFYKKNKKPSLKNIFISIKNGNTLGVCGPTGSGKSTLFQLIQRNFDTSSGKILYGNTPLYKYKLKQWKKKIAVVNQETFLFSDTILNNITFGKNNITYKKVQKYLDIVNMNKEILKLKNQYNTLIGENGILLSGGQKQRIAIARALILEPEILILDDALSAVDGSTEKKILKNLFQWKKKHTTIIMSSHKLSTLRKSNEIIIMKKGKIVDRGTHMHLIKNKNWYSASLF